MSWIWVPCLHPYTLCLYWLCKDKPPPSPPHQLALVSTACPKLREVFDLGPQTTHGASQPQVTTQLCAQVSR